MSARFEFSNIAKAFAREAFGRHYVDDRMLREMAAKKTKIPECRGAIPRLTEAEANYGRAWKNREVQS